MGRWFERSCACALAGVSLWELARLSLHKTYSLDEFQYSHAAWLVARGQVPYRDFFEFHFPLPYQLLAIPYAFLESDPQNIRVLRVAMLAVFALTCAAMVRLNGASPRWVAWAGPLLALFSPAFSFLATEVRPDPLAFALCLFAVALLAPGRAGRIHPFASGVFAALAVWASQKAILYGVIFVAALVLDVTVNRRRGARRLLGDPLRWSVGAAAVAAAVAGYLWITGSAQAWLQQTLIWAAEHERQYPGFSWTRYGVPAFVAHPVLFALGVLGLGSSVHRLSRTPGALSHPDLLLTSLFFSTLFSFAFARAPFPYALVPFVGVLALFAARGLGVLGGIGSGWKRGALAALGTAAIVAPGLWRTEEKLSTTNAYQHEVLAALHRLTDETDPVYDNSGGFTARPHVGFRFYTSALNHAHDAQALAEQVPRDIEGSGCTVFMHDVRFDFLPERLRRYVRDHFVPYNADLWVWGAQFKSGEPGTFHAVRTARYFVSPAQALSNGRLRIDGVPVSGPVFTLERGPHGIDYDGTTGELSIIWLPRNEEQFAPAFGLPPRFSKLF